MSAASKKANILPEGTVFEKYTVVKPIGVGGMGAVYLVRHNLLDTLFALKILFPEIAEKNPYFIERFIREAKLACKIKHNNLIAVHDAGKSADGIYYIVMDYVSGGTVRDLLKKNGRLNPTQALSITVQLCSALKAAHAGKMIHRDIKPENIMFSADGTVKLADLGIAKSLEPQESDLTLTAAVFGTPAYMSPEQAQDSGKVDCRADIYSLGIVFYEMLSGQKPYRGANTIEILSQVISEEAIPDIRTICPFISEELAHLLSAMIDKRLQYRVQSADELLVRLQKLSTLEVEYKAVTPSFSDTQIDELEATIKINPDAAVDFQPPVDPAVEYKRQKRINLMPLPKAESASDNLPDITRTSVTYISTEFQEDVANRVPSTVFSHKKRNIFISIALILLLAVAGVSCLLLRTKPAQPVAGKTEVKALPTPTPAPIQRNTEIALPEPVWASEEPDKSDKLQPGAVIWLGEYSDFIEKLRKAAPGKSKVLFQEPAGLGSYRKQLTAIADAAPEAVLLNISGKYAKNNISLASFENMIREAAAFFRDRNIPAAFVLSASDSANEEIQKFNKAVTELCNLRSINCFKANTPPGEIFETMQIK